MNDAASALEEQAAFWPNSSTIANADHLLPPVDWKARAAELKRQQAAGGPGGPLEAVPLAAENPISHSE